MKTVWYIVAVGRETAPFVAHSRILKEEGVGPETKRLRDEGFKTITVMPREERV